MVSINITTRVQWSNTWGKTLGMFHAAPQASPCSAPRCGRYLCLNSIHVPKCAKAVGVKPLRGKGGLTWWLVPKDLRPNKGLGITSRQSASTNGDLISCALQVCPLWAPHHNKHGLCWAVDAYVLQLWIRISYHVIASWAPSSYCRFGDNTLQASCSDRDTVTPWPRNLNIEGPTELPQPHTMHTLPSLASIQLWDAMSREKHWETSIVSKLWRIKSPLER